MINQSPYQLLARYLSGVLHPLLMPLWCAVVVVYGAATTLTYTPEIAYFVMVSVLRLVVFVPVAFGALLWLFGYISRGTKGERLGMVFSQRRVMLLAVALCGMACGGVFADHVVLFIIRKLMYTTSAVCVALVVLEWVWPVSLHTTAVGALLGVWWVLLYVGNVQLLIPFVVGVAVAGLLCTLRIYLHPERSPWRSIVGLVGGFALSSLLFILL